MIFSKLPVKLSRVERMSDDSTLRTCGLWNFYRTNKVEFDKFAGKIYTTQCDAKRQAAQQAGITAAVDPPTLAECQEFCEQSLHLLPFYGKLRITSSFNPSTTQSKCFGALARYLVENSWNTISQNPCV